MDSSRVLTPFEVESEDVQRPLQRQHVRRKYIGGAFFCGSAAATVILASLAAILGLFQHRPPKELTPSKAWTAVCFAGQARSLSQAAQYSKEGYVGLKDMLSALGPRRVEGGTIAGVDVLASLADLSEKPLVEEMLKPLRSKLREEMPKIEASRLQALGDLEDVTVFHGPTRVQDNPGVRAKIHGIIFWSILQCHEMIKEIEGEANMKYNYIVRARYDQVFERSSLAAVTHTLQNDLPFLGKDGRAVLVTPWIKDHGGVNDQYAIGTRAAMERYAGTFYAISAIAAELAASGDKSKALETILQLCRHAIQTETCLDGHLRQGGILLLKDSRIRAHILRENGLLSEQRL